MKPFIIKWIGGKRRAAQYILPLIPTHQTYVELFGGGASLLFSKKPSPVEVYNDVDSEIVNLFRVIRDKSKMEQLQLRLSLTPFSREESFESSQKRGVVGLSDVERAAHFFYLIYTSFGGKTSSWSWGYAKTESSGGMSSRVSAYLSAIDGLNFIHSRIMRVQIDCDTFEAVIERYDSPDTFFYADPDYIPDATTGGKVYHNTMTVRKHELLHRMLARIKGTAILSGYRHYAHRMLEETYGWNRIDFEARCTLSGPTKNSKITEEDKARTESIWIHPRISKSTSGPKTLLF